MRVYCGDALPGHGEFVPPLLEHADVPYVDVARLPAQDGGPPILQDRGFVLRETAAICAYLRSKFGLWPTGDAVPPLTS